MESPEHWDLLTASLGISNLDDSSSTWAFLIIQGLVRDDPGDRERFKEIVEYEVAHPVTGPSAAARAAYELQEAGIARPGGLTPDPWAGIAAKRLAAIEGWTGRNAAREYLERASYHLDLPIPTAAVRRAWWKLW